MSWAAAQYDANFSKAGSVVVGSPSAAQRVRVELAAADVALLAGTWRWQLHAVLASGRTVTLVAGAIAVTGRVGA